MALWATQQLLPYIPGGEFAHGLEAGREAALALHRRLDADSRFVTPIAPPALDIVFWAPKCRSLAESSALSQAIFDEAARRDLFLALATLPIRFFPPGTWPDRHQATRTSPASVPSCIKPEHLDWIDEIGRRLDSPNPSSTYKSRCQYP